MNRHYCLLILTLITADWTYCRAISAAPIVAVFSSDKGPYQEALQGLKDEFKDGVQPFFLSQGEPKIPQSTQIIIAFGAKAALQKYKDGTILIFAMAPGLEINLQNTIGVNMEPDPSTLLSDLTKIQPGLKKLGVFWQSSSFQDYIELLRKAAQPLGLTIESVPLANSADVPDHLRAIYGKVDAIWLPPDPLLLNAASLPVFMEFSRSNHVPLFVPTDGLVAQGATASVGPSFREFGHLAGVTARKALENKIQESQLYSANVEIVINKTAAEQVGLKISEETLQKANKVIP